MKNFRKSSNYTLDNLRHSLSTTALSCRCCLPFQQPEWWQSKQRTMHILSKWIKSGNCLLHAYQRPQIHSKLNLSDVRGEVIHSTTDPIDFKWLITWQRSLFHQWCCLHALAIPKGIHAHLLFLSSLTCEALRALLNYVRHSSSSRNRPFLPAYLEAFHFSKQLTQPRGNS